jgi:hypothetical protein
MRVLDQPWVVPALGIALVVIGAALIVALVWDGRGERQTETPGRGGRVYRSANAAGRRIGGGR